MSRILFEFFDNSDETTVPVPPPTATPSPLPVPSGGGGGGNPWRRRPPVGTVYAVPEQDAWRKLSGWLETDERAMVLARDAVVDGPLDGGRSEMSAVMTFIAQNVAKTVGGELLVREAPGSSTWVTLRAWVDRRHSKRRKRLRDRAAYDANAAAARELVSQAAELARERASLEIERKELAVMREKLLAATAAQRLLLRFAVFAVGVVATALIVDWLVERWKKYGRPKPKRRRHSSRAKMRAKR